MVNFALARTVGRTAEEMLPTPKRPFPATTIAEVAGYLAYDGPPKTIEEMDTAVQKGIVRMAYAIPKFPTADIQLALTFYEQKLGFARSFDYGDYAAVERDNLEIHLWLCDDKHIAENTGCRVAVTGIEALYVEYQQAGVIHPNGALEEKPWGMKEFVALDMDGNALFFFEE
jgi:catechol 2,3-dioxygenase-like lactoylglutathione lyase family enzyme